MERGAGFSISDIWPIFFCLNFDLARFFSPDDHIPCGNPVLDSASGQNAHHCGDFIPYNSYRLRTECSETGQFLTGVNSFSPKNPKSARRAC